MDYEHPEQYNAIEYRRRRFARYAEGYLLRRTPDGWRWIWMADAAPPV